MIRVKSNWFQSGCLTARQVIVLPLSLNRNFLFIYVLYQCAILVIHMTENKYLLVEIYFSGNQILRCHPIVPSKTTSCQCHINQKVISVISPHKTHLSEVLKIIIASY